MTAVLFSIFALALAAPLVQRALPRYAGWLLAIVPAGSFVLLVVPGAVPPVEHIAWAPSFGLELTLHADGLAKLLGALITGVGALIVVYAGAYLAGHPQQGRFFAYLLAFMGSMLGIALADNLLVLFVFWELTSFSSYLLIGFEHEREAARAAALQALLVTGAGGLALLAGAVLLAQAGGSYSVRELALARDAVVAHRLYAPALVLVLAGAFTKSAQTPFHFWLPNAMEAPTPVSAYLHSSTMVKAGVFLLARLYPVLGGTGLWVGAVAGVGALTAVTGAVLAYRNTDLKRILAYSTVSALGLMTLLLGVGGDLGVRAAMLYLLAHAMYKGALFLVAGTVSHETGEREITRLSGLRGAMPVTAAAAGAAALSMAGIAPLAGFIAKELMLEALVAWETWGLLAAAFVVLASMFLAAVAFLAGVRPFIGAAPRAVAHAHEGSAALVLGSLVLATLGAIAGLWPSLYATPLVDAAALAAGAGMTQPPLALWHGFTPPLLMSAASLAGGAVLAWRWIAPRPEERRLPGPERAYWAALDALTTIAARQTAALQNGYLRHYLLITIAVTLLAVGSTLAIFGGLPALALPAIAVHEAVLVGLILFSTAAAVRSHSRIGAIAALGIVGYSVALLFVSFGAPDLAMTQFVIETLTVILFLLSLQNVPSAHFRATDRGRWRDACLAGGAGALMASLVLLSTTARHSEPISRYFLERSLAEGHGRNVVNVILVDFRGLDTLGEISVLALAGVGVYALLRLRPEAPGGAR